MFGFDLFKDRIYCSTVIAIKFTYENIIKLNMFHQQGCQYITNNYYSYPYYKKNVTKENITSI